MVGDCEPESRQTDDEPGEQTRLRSALLYCCVESLVQVRPPSEELKMALFVVMPRIRQLVLLEQTTFHSYLSAGVVIVDQAPRVPPLSVARRSVGA